jgi:hypothetical protein
MHAQDNGGAKFGETPYWPPYEKQKEQLAPVTITYIHTLKTFKSDIAKTIILYIGR